MPLKISVSCEESAKSNYVRVGCYKGFFAAQKESYLDKFSGDTKPENVRRYKKKVLESTQ